MGEMRQRATLACLSSQFPESLASASVGVEAALTCSSTLQSCKLLSNLPAHQLGELLGAPHDS